MTEAMSASSNLPRKKSASWKRLIVLCDALVKDKSGEEREVEQVIYYQPGVGTGAGDQLRGGAYGLGVSANVRAAFGFLAHNYDPEPGDEIFLFGFSRGAYTARSIAGLVNNLGLLTKRGMDFFPSVYDEFYKDPAKTPDFKFSDGLLKKLRDADVQVIKARHAVKVVGVWDTVGFHAEGMLSKLLDMSMVNRLFNPAGGEKTELHNTELSPKVGYAYHALALDERRLEFKPTLWEWPKDYVKKQDGSGLQDMRQVWFSGTHSDIGGGLYDPRLSNITLAWMIAQCSKDQKLAFVDGEPRNPANQDDYYLLPPDSIATSSGWDTAGGQTTERPANGLLGSFKNMAVNWFFGVGATDRQALPVLDTCERIHRSIQARKLAKWPCGVLRGTHNGLEWPLKTSGEGGDSLMEADADSIADVIEEGYRGRIRPTPGQKGYKSEE